MAFVERAHAAAAAATRVGPPPPAKPPAAASDGDDDDDDARPRARHVGVLAIEVYFPLRYVDQAALEAHDGAPPGKYTTGLGQAGLAFAGDNEDAVSLGLTALDGLLSKTGVPPASVGALYVGSESAPDRAKSIKSCLVRLLAERGKQETRGENGGAAPAPPSLPSASVEGADTLNACYGGTAALFAAVNWVESRAWDGRYAIVVATDIAVYAAGPARPAGGCGAVALLVGPDAPLPLERRVAASWCADVWDFYKPAGLWPVVAGAESIAAYLAGLDATYAGVMAALDARKRERRSKRAGQAAPSPPPPPPSSLADVHRLVFHAPYGKLLRKAYARLAPTDAARAAAAAAGEPPPPPGPGPGYDERAAVAASAPAFDAAVGPSTWLAAAVGNTYTASVFGGLAALVEREGARLAGQRVLLYSYGSGASASLFSIVPRAGGGRFTLATLAASLRLGDRLAARVRAPPAALAAALADAEARYCTADWTPSEGAASVPPGAWYLVRVDAEYRRSYAKRGEEGEGVAGGMIGGATTGGR